jgi:hypothetical protein
MRVSTRKCPCTRTRGINKTNGTSERTKLENFDATPRRRPGTPLMLSDHMHARIPNIDGRGLGRVPEHRCFHTTSNAPESASCTSICAPDDAVISDQNVQWRMEQEASH